MLHPASWSAFLSSYNQSISTSRVNHSVNHQLFSQPATDLFLPTLLRRHTGSDKVHEGRFSHPIISESISQSFSQSSNIKSTSN